MAENDINQTPQDTPVEGNVLTCDTATLYLTSLPINTTESEDDFTNTPFDTPVTGDVTTNDGDAEGDNQTYALDDTNSLSYMTKQSAICIRNPE